MAARATALLIGGRHRLAASLAIAAMVAIWLSRNRSKLTLLLGRPLGLRGVTNPAPAQGGAAADEVECARANAPTRVSTLKRVVVSLRDYEELALTSPQVAKARAALVRNGGERVLLAIAGERGRHLSPDALSALEATIDAQRDPARSFEIVDYDEVPLRINAVIDVFAAGVRTVDDAARAGLLEALSFERRDLGESLDADELQQVLRRSSGVSAVRLELLRYREESQRLAHDAPDVAVLNTVPIRSWELATLDPLDLQVRVD